MAGRRIPIKIIPKATSNGVVYSTFPSMTSCAKELHIQESHISEVCSGKRRQHAGYRFEYATNTSDDNTFICCICGKTYTGWGNDPWPVNQDENAKCCDACNMSVVVSARLKLGGK